MKVYLQCYRAVGELRVIKHVAKYHEALPVTMFTKRNFIMKRPPLFQQL